MARSSTLVFGALHRIAAILCACSVVGCTFLAPLDEYDPGTAGGGGSGGSTTSSSTSSSATSTSSGAMCGPFDYPGTSSLIDRFEDGVPGPAWAPQGSCPPTESGGEVTFTPPAN